MPKSHEDQTFLSIFCSSKNKKKEKKERKKKKKEMPGGSGGGGSRDASGSQEVLSTTCVQLLVARLWRASRVEAVGVVCSLSRSSATPGPLTNLFQLTYFPPSTMALQHDSPLLFDASIGPSRSRCIVGEPRLDAIRGTSNWPGLNENDPATLMALPLLPAPGQWRPPCCPFVHGNKIRPGGRFAIIVQSRDCTRIAWAN